jgi:hypothetical protein
MQKMKNSNWISCALAIAAYALLTALIALLYSEISAQIHQIDQARFLLALFGPVLALFTHMSILLFLPLSIPFVALILIGAVFMEARKVSVIAFSISWLSIGWYLAGLFAGG